MRLATRSSKTSRVVGGALLALVATGCSNGSEPASPNRGSGSDTTGTVENAFIVPAFVPGRCATQVDDGAELRFTVTNGSTTDPGQLLGLTTDAAKVAAIGASTSIPPRGVVAFRQPSAMQIDLAGRAFASRHVGERHLSIQARGGRDAACGGGSLSFASEVREGVGSPSGLR